MASDLSSGCTDVIDILDDEKEEGEISLEDVSSSEEGGMGHLTSSYVVGRTRACPDCKSWGECATWCNATYHPKSRRDPVKGKENRRHVRETGAATKHLASTLQEKNDDDDLVPISSDSDMEIVGLTDTSNRSKAKVKKKKRKKKNYESLTLDELLSPSSIDLSIADVRVGSLKVYREISPGRIPSGRSKVIPRSPVRRYRSPAVAARSSFRSSRSPVSNSRSPIQKRTLRKVRSPKRSPRRPVHSPVRAAKRPPSKLSSPSFARSHVPSDRHGDVTRLLKRVKRLDSMGTHASEPSVNRSKESSSLKEKLSNMLKRSGSDDHALHLKGKSKVQSKTMNDADDEEDLALLRQKALETKPKKSNRSTDHLTDAESEKISTVNDDQDEEALQLRMIALRSAVMKKHQNRVERGIKAKRSTRSESPFSSSFLDDIPVPSDELYVSPLCSPSYDSNNVEDMDLDTDVEREKEKLPYSPTDKITEHISIDTALLGIEPSDVSFINVNETIGSPVFDNAQDELETNTVTLYYDKSYLSYQVLPATEYIPYSPSQSCSEIYHADLNDAAGKGPDNPHGHDVVCDLIDGICCQEGTYSSTGVASDTTHSLPVSKSLLAPPVSPHDTLPSSPQMQQIVEQSTNDDVEFVNVDSTFRNEKSVCDTQTTPGYSVTDAPVRTAYAESMSLNEPMITIDDLPENDADLLSCPSVALVDDRNLPATEHIPKEAAPCRATAEEPLYMQGVPDITKDTNKIPTLINRTLVPAPILKSNRQLRQRLKKRETPNPEPAFKSAEMQPVTVTTTDTSTSVFKPIKLQAAKKPAPVLSASATFDDSMNESLDMAENQGDSPGKDHEAGEPEHPEAADTPSASSEAAPTRSDKRKHAKNNCRKSLDMPLLESEESSCSDASVNKDTDIVNASALDRQTAVESDQSKSNDNADAQGSSIGNGESLRLQSVTDTQEPANSRLLTERRDVEKNNNIMALSDRLRVVEHSQEEHIKSHCLSTNPAPDNSDSNVPDKAVNTTKSDSNRRQSIDEDENELRAILLASLKRTKTTDISPSVTPVISVTSSAATNVQTPALKTLAGTMPSVANATCTASSNVAPSLPSRPLTSLETVKKKINNVSVTVQNGSRKRSSSLDAAKSPPKKMTRKTLTSTKVVNNAKKYQNMIVQRRLNLRKLDNSATITKPNENVWPNAGASKISSHAPDTQRFVISLGSDTDSESEGERNEPVSVPVADKHQVHQEIPADFEKNLNKFLRDMRTEQEQSAAAAKSTSSSTQATKQDVPQTDKGPSNMHTPLAVRHLPVSQQEEYRRLKQQILEREKLKLQRKVASNNGSSNSSSNSNKLSNANVTSSPVKSLPLYEKKAHIKQNQDKLKTPEKNSQELPVEVRRKSDDLARGTSESNVSRMSADKKLSANIAKHTNLTNLQTKSNKKVIPNNLSIRISNVTTLSSTEGTRTVEDREKQSMKDKQQHRPTLRALSKEEINRKCVQVQLKPDTIERVVIISDKSALQHDTTASVDQNKNPAEPDVSTEIINKKNLSNVNDNNTSAFSNASTVKLLNSSAISNVSRHEDTMETTMTFSQYETERQREISRDASTSVLAKNNDSSNASRKSDTIANDNGKANDIWDELKKDVRAELDSLTSLSELEQERYLRETEHKLVAKRYMVLDHLAEMSGNLRQWDMEEDLQTTLANEVRKLKEQLKIAEEKLQQQRDRVSSMSPKVSTARQKINAGRRECFKLSSICSTLGNRVIGRDYKLPEAVAQLLSDKIKEVANHTSQISKKKRLQPNDISENSYSSLLQETSELSKDTCTEENLSLQEQPTNNATMIDEAGSKGISRSTQSNEDKSLSISETSNFSQTVLCQSTPEKRGKTSVNPSEHCNEEQIIFLNQNSALSEPKLYQSNPTEQNKHTEGSRTDESAPAASSELKSTAADSSNQEYNEQNNTRASPQLPSPSPSPYSPSSPSSSPSSPPSPSSSPSSSSAPSPSPSPSSAPSPSSSPSSVPLPSPSSAPSPSPSPSRSPSPITMTTTDTTTINTVTTTSTATTTTTTTTRTAKMIAPYESILMHLKKPRNINPNGILCPYELMGICRDEDCQYIHQSRNQT